MLTKQRRFSFHHSVLLLAFALTALTGCGDSDGNGPGNDGEQTFESDRPSATASEGATREGGQDDTSESIVDADAGAPDLRSDPVQDSVQINFSTVVYGDDLFVAVGDRVDVLTEGFEITSVIVASSDGHSWDLVAEETNTYLYDVAFGNGVFVAIGDITYDQHVILISKNGLQWERKEEIIRDHLNSVVFGNGEFLLSAGYGQKCGVYGSADGSRWEYRSSWCIGEMVFGEGIFLGTSSGPLLQSNSGEQWPLANIPDLGLTWIRSVDYVAGRFVVIAENDCCFGEVVSRIEYYFLSSADGVEWDVATAGESDSTNVFAFGNDAYVAVNETGIFAGSELGPVSGLTLVSTNATKLQEVVFAQGKFVAVGSDGIYTSRDGYVWSKSPGIRSNPF